MIGKEREAGVIIRWDLVEGNQTTHWNAFSISVLVCTSALKRLDRRLSLLASLTKRISVLSIDHPVPLEDWIDRPQDCFRQKVHSVIKARSIQDKSLGHYRKAIKARDRNENVKDEGELRKTMTRTTREWYSRR